MHYSLEPGNSRHILRVNDDSTEDPFAVVFDPDAGQLVVDALNATPTKTLRSAAVPLVNQAVGPINGSVIQVHTVHGGVRA